MAGWGGEGAVRTCGKQQAAAAAATAAAAAAGSNGQRCRYLATVPFWFGWVSLGWGAVTEGLGRMGLREARRKEERWAHTRSQRGSRVRSGSVSERESDGEIGKSETGDSTYYLAPGSGGGTIGCA